ncbi:hypothetical protein NSMM_490006 [Nitrosomonas mobilis]|uniref:Uncharacterized protein n=1 Tax=Nitrosomonas mobilis TaxID=51642 RepID=A0A1G5SGJ4_9PROT|nr:hypothetical protein NSMM_490006 [Nitrosomonas mobilis]
MTFREPIGVMGVATPMLEAPLGLEDSTARHTSPGKNSSSSKAQPCCFTVSISSSNA